MLDNSGLNALSPKHIIFPWHSKILRSNEECLKLLPPFLVSEQQFAECYEVHITSPAAIGHVF